MVILCSVERYSLVQTSINIAAPTRFAPLAFDLIDFLLVWSVYMCMTVFTIGCLSNAQ
jgi:hypothetical protein